VKKPRKTDHFRTLSDRLLTCVRRVFDRLCLLCRCEWGWCEGEFWERGALPFESRLNEIGALGPPFSSMLWRSVFATDEAGGGSEIKEGI
jgi:hypothetical protein